MDDTPNLSHRFSLPQDGDEIQVVDRGSSTAARQVPPGVFCFSPSASPHTPLEGDGSEQPLAENLCSNAGEAHKPAKRQLRRQGKPMREFPSTWLDADDTGDYDPTEEERKPGLKRAPAKAVQQECPLGGRSSDNVRDEIEALSDAMKPPRRICTLKFTSTDLRAKLGPLNQSTEQPNESSLAFAGYNLRKRVDQKNIQASVLHREDDNADLLSDLNGYPVARGCYACVKLFGVSIGDSSCEHCSLLDNESSWPCKHCTADECQIIMPPVRVRACESCKRRRTACSFSSTRNHGKSCVQCAHLNLRCIAGPVTEFIKPRIRYDRDWKEHPYPQPRKDRSGRTKVPDDCIECLQANKSCSYEADRYDGHYRYGCTNCLAADLPCTIHDDRLKSARKADLPLVDGIASSSDQMPTSNLSSHPISKPRGAPQQPSRTAANLRRITTSFSHPVVFNSDVPSQGGKPCHFCAEPTVSIFGFGKLEVEVIDDLSSNGYTETKDGHHGNGVDNNKLCTQCTTDRMLIVMCERHEMRPLPETDTTDESQKAAWNALLVGEIPDIRAYCAICAVPVAYQCAAANPGLGEEGALGCGLRLCGFCAGHIERVYGGRLTKMLHHIDAEANDERPLGLRADHEFLRVDGPLLRYVWWLIR